MHFLFETIQWTSVKQERRLHNKYTQLSHSAKTDTMSLLIFKDLQTKFLVQTCISPANGVV